MTTNFNFFKTEWCQNVIDMFSITLYVLFIAIRLVIYDLNKKKINLKIN